MTIYSKNRYQSYDLDYITYEDMKKVKKALQEDKLKKIKVFIKRLKNIKEMSG